MPVAVHGVVGRLGGDGHGPGEVHASRDQRGQDPAHTLDDGRLDEDPDDGELQHESVELGPSLPSIDACDDHSDDHEDDDRQNGPPPCADEVRTR